MVSKLGLTWFESVLRTSLEAVGRQRPAATIGFTSNPLRSNFKLNLRTSDFARFGGPELDSEALSSIEVVTSP